MPSKLAYPILSYRMHPTPQHPTPSYPVAGPCACFRLHLPSNASYSTHPTVLLPTQPPHALRALCPRACQQLNSGLQAPPTPFGCVACHRPLCTAGARLHAPAGSAASIPRATLRGLALSGSMHPVHGRTQCRPVTSTWAPPRHGLRRLQGRRCQLPVTLLA